MARTDRQGRPYLRFRDAAAGRKVWLGGGFTCRGPGPAFLRNGNGGVCFDCCDGEHLIDGQHDGDGFLVGIYGQEPGEMVWQQSPANDDGCPEREREHA